MNSLAELAVIREKMQSKVAIRKGELPNSADNKVKKHVLICGGTGCTS